MSRYPTYKGPRWHFWLFFGVIPLSLVLLVGTLAYFIAKWVFF